ncbi:MAG: DNA polymerase III subunit alpha [Solirubrobacterales bacterium]
MAEYVELHAHSAYSFHDGVSQPHELAAAAAERGYAAFALTDHDAVHGSMEFAHAAAPLGVKAIHGTELTLDRGHHVTLIAENQRGWSTLCRLLTAAHASTRSADAQRSPQQPCVSLDQLLAHAEEGAGGLICLSGCAARGVLAARIARGEVGAAEGIARRLLGAFGRSHFRVELQRPFQRHDRQLNQALERIAENLKVPTVATGNVHAHARERAALQDVFVAVKHNASLDETEPLRRGNSSHVLVAPREMTRRFAEHPRAVAETAEIARRIDFDLTADLGYRYPGAEDPEQGKRLRAVCEQRLIERYGDSGDREGSSVGRRRVGIKEARARLEQELRVIEKLRLPGFFLIHHDLLEMAREVACEVRGSSDARGVLPPGRGRGSSVSSIVCYLTGLSHVDPLEANLCIGRFLHEEITSLPDIDLDFPRDIRQELIPRVHERYGHERSALVAAFPTYRTRGALRALAKALALPTPEIERILRTADRSYGEGLTERVEAAIRESPAGSRMLASSRWQALLRLLPQIHRLPRGLSQHSGGMVISTDPLIDVCPVAPAAMPRRQIVQWDKDSCSDAGFAKIDLLGLGMLSAVERIVDLIDGARDERVDLSRIPLDDPETFRQIRGAETTGVFQIESRAQMQMLVRSRPETLGDIFIQVAIVRPGPITGGAVHPYLERRKLLRADPSYKVPMPHPLLEDVLGETLGAIVFQDQVIEVARALADFSPSEGEGLRRAMSRKRSKEALVAYHRRFVDGAAQNGVSEGIAEEVFAQVVGFSGFGFPKAHAAAFGLLAYQTSWLRAHYPAEFLCGLMNEQPMGFYLPDALAHEAQRRGLTVLPPDVNASGVECSVEWIESDRGESSVSPQASQKVPQPTSLEGAQRRKLGQRTALESRSSMELAVRIGLGYVKGAKETGLRSLVAARAEGGLFKTVEDLASRSGADGSTLEKLAWAGACDDVGTDGAARTRREALWLLGAAPAGETKADESAQLALPIAPLPAPRLNKLGDWEEMVADYGATGLTVGTHPLELLREGLDGQNVLQTTAIDRAPEGTFVKVSGLVVARQRPGTAKGVVFVLLEDEVGVVNLILPPPIYVKHRVVVRSEPLLTASGKVERRTGATNVIVTHISPLLGKDVEDAVRQIRRPATSEQDVRGKMGIDTDTALAAMNGDFDAARKVMGEAADIRAVAPVGINFGRKGR